MVQTYGAPAMSRYSSLGRLPAASQPTPFPTKETGLSRGSCTLPGFFPAGSGPGKKSSTAAQRRSRSAGQLEVAEVRSLAGDEPQKGETEAHQPKSPHEALMQRLKSRAARAEAENSKTFLAAYRNENVSSLDSEKKLDHLIKAASQRAEELRAKSEELQQEAAEAERKLEKANVHSTARATDADLMNAGLNAFERSQRRIQEDKREEEVSRQRDEVQASYARVHRRLQNELIELRDFKVLLREFRRVRLEKLHEQLGRVTDGRRLRSCVKEMIRHGAQRILQKLEGVSVPLEPWMCEVLVNCGHVEIRIEDAEEKLLHVRRRALHPVKQDIQVLLSQTKQERFDNLCTRTWESTQVDEHGRRAAAASGMAMAMASRSAPGPGPGPAATMGDWGSSNASAANLVATGGQLTLPTCRPSIAEPLSAEIRSAEANIAALRRLLSDMRHNAAAVICNQIRQVEKGGASQASEAMEWGRRTLSLLVSEDFAKQTMKALQKSAPQSKLTE